ncbi:MAG: hypothetical protein ACI4AK_07160, partial [Lepagella sp.]
MIFEKFYSQVICTVQFFAITLHSQFGNETPQASCKASGKAKSEGQENIEILLQDKQRKLFKS